MQWIARGIQNKNIDADTINKVNIAIYEICSENVAKPCDRSYK